jgi:hypothetical protein
METVHAYELRIRGLDNLLSFAAARWELFAIPDLLDLVRGQGRDLFVVLYEGDQVDPDAWCRLLANAGYPAEPLGRVDSTGKAA